MPLSSKNTAALRYKTDHRSVTEDMTGTNEKKAIYGQIPVCMAVHGYDYAYEEPVYCLNWKGSRQSTFPPV